MRNPSRVPSRRGPRRFPVAGLALLAVWLVPVPTAASALQEGRPEPGFRFLPDSLWAATETVPAGLNKDPATGLRKPVRDMGGATGLVLLPQGEFAAYVGDGFGLDLHGTRYMDSGGVLGIRLDLGVATYGHQSTTLDLGLVAMDVSTENDIFMLTLGPQLRLGRGDLQGYVRGFGGLSYFVTFSSVNEGGESFFEKTHVSDLVPAAGLGAGLLIRVRKGPKPLYLDLSVEVRRQGTTRYARKGGVAVRDGRAEATTFRSRTDMLLVGLGLAFGE